MKLYNIQVEEEDRIIIYESLEKYKKEIENEIETEYPMIKLQEEILNSKRYLTERLLRVFDNTI